MNATATDLAAADSVDGATAADTAGDNTVTGAVDSAVDAAADSTRRPRG